MVSVVLNRMCVYHAGWEAGTETLHAKSHVCGCRPPDADLYIKCHCCIKINIIGMDKQRDNLEIQGILLLWFLNFIGCHQRLWSMSSLKSFTTCVGCSRHPRPLPPPLSLNLSSVRYLFVCKIVFMRGRALACLCVCVCVYVSLSLSHTHVRERAR